MARQRPIVIAHRGASSERPEHTLAAYRLAIEQGADFIEPDLVATADGVLIARHENELSGTTDVAAHPEFAARRTTKWIDGRSVTGWFSEDFSWAEIRTLRARERIPAIRPGNTAFDGQERVPSLAEILQLVRAVEAAGRSVGIYPETKHPSWFAREGTGIDGRRIDHDLGRLLVAELLAEGFTDPRRVYIQSFELGNLLDLATTVLPASGLELPLILLLDDCSDRDAGMAPAQPRDFVLAGAFDSDRIEHEYPGLQTALGRALPQAGYSDLCRPAALRWLREHGVAGIGPWKDNLLPRRLGGASRLEEMALRQLTGEVHPMLQAARATGLEVHPYTLRAEPAFAALDVDGSPLAMETEMRRLLDAGATGFFSDFPARGVAVRDAWWAAQAHR